MFASRVFPVILLRGQGSLIMRSVLSRSMSHYPIDDPMFGLNEEQQQVIINTPIFI